jgi:hypothetical protein
MLCGILGKKMQASNSIFRPPVSGQFQNVGDNPQGKSEDWMAKRGEAGTVSPDNLFWADRSAVRKRQTGRRSGLATITSACLPAGLSVSGVLLAPLLS